MMTDFATLTGYFKHARPSTFLELDQMIRRRLR
jgi:hypothetical protein